jgi:hypothetical protein
MARSGAARPGEAGQREVARRNPGFLMLLDVTHSI